MDPVMRLFATLFFLFLVGGGVIVLYWNWLLCQFFQKLKTEMPETFQAMGRPGIVTVESPTQMWAQLRFILKREYQADGSFTLTQLGDRLYRLFWIFLMVIGLMILSFLLLVLYSFLLEMQG